jgi:hypothetical protein
MAKDLQEAMERIPAMTFSSFMRQPEGISLWPGANKRYLSNLSTRYDVGKIWVQHMIKHGQVLPEHSQVNFTEKGGPFMLKDV